MAAFSPYLIDEIGSQFNLRSNYFGLIGNTEADQVELHGYEVTMSGELVLPELHPQPNDELKQSFEVIEQC